MNAWEPALLSIYLKNIFHKIMAKQMLKIRYLTEAIVKGDICNFHIFCIHPKQILFYILEM